MHEEELRAAFEDFIRQAYPSYSLDRFRSPAPMVGVYVDQFVKAMWVGYQCGYARARNSPLEDTAKQLWTAYKEGFDKSKQHTQPNRLNLHATP
jgi:hypothetical protein